MTNKEKNVLKNIDRYAKNISKHLKNLKKHFKKLHKYEHNTTHDLDYLFNEHNEEDRITEPITLNNDINAIQETRKLLNERRSNLLLKETKRIEKDSIKKRLTIIFLKEKEQEGSLTDKQKNVLKNIGRYLKKLNKDFKKLQKYQYNITYGLDYLFNEVSEEDYYEPKEIKCAFDGSYMIYESKGDKDAKLELCE